MLSALFDPEQDPTLHDDLPLQQTEIGTLKVYEIPHLVSVQILQDSSKSCGGKTWDVAFILSEYLSHSLLKQDEGVHHILELGSGTGVGGIFCSKLLSKFRPGSEWSVTMTDLAPLLPLMRQNVDLNLDPHQQKRTRVQEFAWGSCPKSLEKDKIDMIIGADCIYLEETFDVFIQTLRDLTQERPLVPILLAFQRRRKAEKKFWKKLAKYFHIQEVLEDPKRQEYTQKRQCIVRCLCKS